MSFLLPQTRDATVLQVRALDLHGDRYLDVLLQVDGADGGPASGRLGAADCPDALAAGERVQARFAMGVLMGLARSERA